MKKLSKSAKKLRVAKKNHYYFFLKFNRDSGFRKEMDSFVTKYGSKKDYQISGFQNDDKDYAVMDFESEYAQARLEILRQSPDDKKFKEILAAAVTLTDKFGFGSEWVDTLITLVGKNKFVPPYKNFFLGRTFDGRRVTIELNPDTSLEDIEAHIRQIRKLQKERWQGFKKINVRKNLLPRLRDEIFSDWMKRNPESFGVDPLDLDPNISQYDTIRLKNERRQKDNPKPRSLTYAELAKASSGKISKKTVEKIRKKGYRFKKRFIG